MPYDEQLADRIRAVVGDRGDLDEARMFGGLAFLVGGHLAVAASHEGGLLVRVAPDETDRLLSTTSARPMEMRGRELQGWLRVAAEDVRTKGQLSRWVDRGVTYAASLPPKATARRR